MAGWDGSKALSIVLRIIALCLSVAAAVVMGTASDQVLTVDGDRRPSSYAAVSYSQYDALKYFVAAAAISASCSAAALYLCAVRAAAAAVGSLPLVPLLDAAAQAFLFSAAGAAFAARGAAPSGPRCSSGGSVCDAAGAFCGKVSLAAAGGAIAAVAVAVAALATDDARRSGSGGSSCC